jgi:uncharacterized protein YcfL
MDYRIVTSLIAVVVVISLVGCGYKAETATMKSAETVGNLYMDIHKNVEGLTAEAVIGAHKADLEVQKKHGVNYVDYWYDTESGTVFCLVEAPSKEAAALVHQEAHGLVADEIIEVAQGM